MMIWSLPELARLVVCKEDVIIERVIKHLDEPENQEIWQPQYFSYLWGILGVVGVAGFSQTSAVKLWSYLNENKVLDAFKNGILDDFNRRLVAQCSDERMRGWLNLDNFMAGIKFEKTILRPLAELDEQIGKDVAKICPDVEAIIGRIHRLGVDDEVRDYLESIRSVANDENKYFVDIIFDKEQSLLKLTKAIAYTNHNFSEKEKDFLWYYLLDAVHKGFDVRRIGLNDKVLARLIAVRDENNVSELDVSFLQTRNDNIYEFWQEFGEKEYFYEETAAKLIMFNPEQIAMLMEECLSFAEKSHYPKGVVFALALINLKQIKSAVTVLQALAQHGVVTEACGFIHRLLPLAKDGESVIVELLETNLRELKKRSFLAKDVAYQEFITCAYLQAVKAFVDNACISNAADLLCFTANEAWIKDNEKLVNEFKNIGNELLIIQKDVADKLRVACEQLKLNFYEDDELLFIGDKGENPLALARHRLEQTIKDTTTFDVSNVLDKAAPIENTAYNILQNFMQSFKKKDNVALPQDVANNYNITESTVNTSTVELASADNVNEVQMEPAAISSDTGIDKVVQVDQNAVNLDVDDNKKGISGNLQRFIDKIMGSKLLNISSSKIDNHFEQIKQTTDKVVMQAKDRMKRIKQRIKNREEK